MERKSAKAWFEWLFTTILLDICSLHIIKSFLDRFMVKIISERLLD